MRRQNSLGSTGEGKGVEFPAMIFYKFVRVILTLLLRIEAHDCYE